MDTELFHSKSSGNAMTAWQWASIHKTSTLQLKQLNAMHPSWIVLFTPLTCQHIFIGKKKDFFLCITFWYFLSKFDVALREKVTRVTKCLTSRNFDLNVILDERSSGVTKLLPRHCSLAIFCSGLKRWWQMDWQTNWLLCLDRYNSDQRYLVIVTAL